jgi:hypothetical protein
VLASLFVQEAHSLLGSRGEEALSSVERSRLEPPYNFKGVCGRLDYSRVNAQL